jgi:hypothetical protein
VTLWIVSLLAPRSFRLPSRMPTFANEATAYGPLNTCPMRVEVDIFSGQCRLPIEAPNSTAKCATYGRIYDVDAPVSSRVMTVERVWRR